MGLLSRRSRREIRRLGNRRQENTDRPPLPVDAGVFSPVYAAFLFRAQMAELVDALRSGRSVLLDVEVRVLFWAPNHSPEWFYFVQNP